MDQNGWCTWQPPNDGNRKNYGKPSNLGYIFSDTPIHTLNLCHEKNTTYECLKHVGTKMVIPKGSLAFNGKAWQFPDWTQSYRPNIWCLVEVTLFQAGIDFHVHGGSQVSYPKMIVKDQSSNLWSRKIRKTFFGKSIQIRPRPGPLAQAFFIFFLEFFPSSMKWYPNKTPHHQPPDSRRDPQSPRGWRPGCSLRCSSSPDRTTCGHWDTLWWGGSGCPAVGDPDFCIVPKQHTTTRNLRNDPSVDWTSSATVEHLSFSECVELLGALNNMTSLPNSQTLQYPDSR